MSRVSVAGTGTSSQGRDTVQDPAGRDAGNAGLRGLHKVHLLVDSVGNR